MIFKDLHSILSLFLKYTTCFARCFLREISKSIFAGVPGIFGSIFGNSRESFKFLFERCILRSNGNAISRSIKERTTGTIHLVKGQGNWWTMVNFARLARILRKGGFRAKVSFGRVSIFEGSSLAPSRVFVAAAAADRKRSCRGLQANTNLLSRTTFTAAVEVPSVLRHRALPPWTRKFPAAVPD